MYRLYLQLCKVDLCLTEFDPGEGGPQAEGAAGGDRLLVRGGGVRDCGLD